MKIRLLSRSDSEWSGRNDGTPNVARPSRNASPALHPPQRPLDLQRAVNAAKLTRTFARPFLFTCNPSHIDGVYAMARSHTDISLMATASADGEVRLWHLPTHSPRFSLNPKPAAFIRDLTFSHDSRRLLFCSDAKIVFSADVAGDYDNNPSLVNSLTNYRLGAPSASISARRSHAHFATATSSVQLWDETRSSPLSTLTVSADSIHCVRFNPIEPHLLASAASDRSIVFYDVRANVPIRRLVLSHRSNDLSWNPLEAMHLVAANDDHNCYTYDMRNLSEHGAKNVHKDHTSAVMSVDFSPTGQEFVTGSYDKTVRIFPYTSARSREIYHTRRMQRVFSVRYTLDGAYVVSGSDDGDVRVWKSERSRPLKPLFFAERQKVQTSERLIERYRHVEQVRKIGMKRHVPRHVLTMQATKRIMKDSRMRKDDNVRRHIREDKQKKRVPERKQNVVRELE